MVFKFDNTLSLVVTNVNRHDLDEALFKKVFKDQHIGEISSVKFEERPSKNNKHFYKATIHFDKWYDNIISRNFQERLYYHNNAHIVFIDPWHWNIIKNPKQQKAKKQEKKNNRRSLVTEIDWFKKPLTPTSPSKLNIKTIPFTPSAPFKKAKLSSEKLCPSFMTQHIPCAASPARPAMPPYVAILEERLDKLTKDVEHINTILEVKQSNLFPSNTIVSDYSNYCAENGLYNSNKKIKLEQETEDLANSCVNSIFVGDDETYEYNQHSAATATNCANNVFLGDDETYELNQDTKETSSKCANYVLDDEVEVEDTDEVKVDDVVKIEDAEVNLADLEHLINITPYCEGCELLMQGLGGENQLAHTCWQTANEYENDVASVSETADEASETAYEVVEEAEEAYEVEEENEIPHTDDDICSCGDCIHLRQENYYAHMNYVNQARAYAYYNYNAMLYNELRRRQMIMAYLQQQQQVNNYYNL